MVQEHIARAGRVGAGIGSDDAVEAEDRLDRIAVEPAVEPVAGGAREEVEEIALAFGVEAADAVRGARGAREFGQARDEAAPGRHVRRRLEGERADDVGDAREPRLVGRKALGVARRELRRLRRGPPWPDLKKAPVGQGQEIGERPLDDAQAVPGKVEVADDRRMEERHRVGRDRVAEAGREFLGRRRAADGRSALENQGLEAGRGRNRRP